MSRSAVAAGWVTALAAGLVACGSPVLLSSDADRQPSAVHIPRETTASPSITALPVAADLSSTTLPSVDVVERTSVAAPVPADTAIVASISAAASWAPAIVVAIPTPAFTAPSATWPVDRVVFVGDSLTFDARVVGGGRPNDIVSLVQEFVHQVAALSDVKIINRSIPGLATLYAINPEANPGRDTLAEQIPHALRGGQRESILLVIPVSSSDLNVSEDRITRDVIDEVVDELERVHHELVAASVQVVFVPAFGVNDAMYDDVRNGLAADRPEHHLNARVEQLNQRLLQSPLPMLVADFDGLGSHDPGGAKSEFFVGYDDRFDPWPDDGIHPNREGERLFASVVGPALVELLTNAVGDS